MKYCTHCGHELASDARFCAFCGAALPQPAERLTDETTAAACDSVISAPAAPQSAAAPAYTPPKRQRSPRQNGLAVAGFVLSLVGLTFFWIPTLGPTMMLAGVALCLSIAGFVVGLVKKRSWGLAVAGLIISLVALIANLAVLYFS